MVKRKKKYNPNLALRRKAKALLRNYVAAFITGEKYGGHVVLYNVHTNEVIRTPRQEVHQALTELRHHWDMYIAVHGVKYLFDHSIKKEMVYEHLGTDSLYFHEELIPIFNEKHKELLKSERQDKIVGAGWLASINGHKLTETQVLNIFVKLGAYENI